MLVPTEDAQYAAFFYILKKKLEKGRTAKIFVPINGVEYTTTYLKNLNFRTQKTTCGYLQKIGHQYMKCLIKR